MSNQTIQQHSRPVNSRNARTLYLVSCTKSKHGTAMEAKDLYRVSARFSHSRCIVESTGEPWFILSAKHGLLRPESFIEPYERAMKDLSRPERRSWAQRVIADLDQYLDGVTRVCFLTGKGYYEFLLGPLVKRGVEIETPLAHLNQGNQLSWLKARCLEGL